MLSGWPSKTDNRPSLPWKRDQISEAKIIGSEAYKVLVRFSVILLGEELGWF